MDLTLADQRILMFNEQITYEEAQAKAWDKKMNSFDTISKLGSFLSKPKDEDFELLYKEFRFEPFWHVIANSHYVYDRNTNYQVKVSGSEVKKVIYLEKDYEVTNGHIHLGVNEHCEQSDQEEVLVEGVTGKNNPLLKKYLALSPIQINENLQEMTRKNAITIPPQARISAIMRDSLSKMIKGIQADKILEESIKVECVDLYYRPVYAFKYLWKSKAKEAIVEIDGLTGEISTGTRTFSEYMGKMLNKDFLFDLGADAAGILIPGGSIAVKLVKKYTDSKDL